jgi:hypothetical protein
MPVQRHHLRLLSPVPPVFDRRYGADVRKLPQASDGWKSPQDDSSAYAARERHQSPVFMNARSHTGASSYLSSGSLSLVLVKKSWISSSPHEVDQELPYKI